MLLRISGKSLVRSYAELKKHGPEKCSAREADSQEGVIGGEKQQITHKGIPIRATADLSMETLQARREWQDIPIKHP